MGFLLTRRWIGFGAFVIILAVLCVLLGRWQFHRAEDRQAENERIAAALAIDPIPLQDLDSVAEHEWTRVEATGRFDTNAVVTVRYMQRDGAPGVDVVAPFILSDGSAILVDAGWMSTDNSGDKPESIPTLPDADVTIEGWWRVDSGAGSNAVTPRDDQVRAIASHAWTTPYELQEGWLNLQSPGIDGLTPEPVPSSSNGPHFAYGLQWWFFGALALFGFIWFARAERLENRKAAQAKATNSA